MITYVIQYRMIEAVHILYILQMVIIILIDISTDSRIVAYITFIEQYL